MVVTHSGGQSHIPWFDHQLRPLSGGRLHKTEPQQSVHRLFERRAGAPDLGV
jgi:hypothetical protein